jgi:hypothetical protein
MRFTSIVSSLILAVLLLLTAGNAVAYDPDDPRTSLSEKSEGESTAGWDVGSAGEAPEDALSAPSEEEPALPDLTGPQAEEDGGAPEAEVAEAADVAQESAVLTPIVINPLMSAGIFVVRPGIRYRNALGT